jgi:ADP-heptose:LPS heptosyltransferase
MSRSSPSAERTIVIYRLGSLGDTIVALPCFHQIASIEADARRIVLTNVPVSSKAAPLEGILGGSGLIHGTMAYPVGTRSVAHLWALRRELRALGARTLYYLTPARGKVAAWRDWAFFKACGFRDIIGIPLSTDKQNHRLDPHTGHLEQEARRLARCLAPRVHVDLHAPDSWTLGLSPAEVSVAQRLIAPLVSGPFVVINMGGKVVKNDWGADNWANLLPAISGDFPTLGLLVVGGPEDATRADDALLLWHGPGVNACGRLTPRESAAAMQAATLFIGHDSGPMHLAAAMQVPCIGLFGDNNPPAKWHPFGPHHQVLHRMEGVQTIAVSEVLAYARQMLHTSLPARKRSQP